MSRLDVLNEKEALRYLGYRGQELDEQTRALFDQAVKETLEQTRGAYTCRLFRLGAEMELYESRSAQMTRKGSALSEGLAFTAEMLEADAFQEQPALTLSGEHIAKNLKGATHIILFAATLGQGMDRAILSAEHRSMTHALMMDACASAHIETICDLCNDAVDSVAVELGFRTRPRFSPGYGDLPLALQPKLCHVLDAHRQIGLSCSPNALLMPRKSVTAIIGLVPAEDYAPMASESSCSICALRVHCDRRICKRSVE